MITPGCSKPQRLCKDQHSDVAVPDTLGRALPGRDSRLEYCSAAEVDRGVAESLIRETDGAELFLYPGSGHLFADPSLDDYDVNAARLLKERILAFLRRVG